MADDMVVIDGVRYRPDHPKVKELREREAELVEHKMREPRKRTTKRKG